MSATPKLGPEPVLLSRKEVDALYETLEAVTVALRQLKVDYVVTGGSLLGAIRQHSLLFCDDDIDIAILLDNESSHDSDSKNGREKSEDDDAYQLVVQNLQRLLDDNNNNNQGKNKRNYLYQVRPWEGGDRIRPMQYNNVFVDLFCLRRYDTMQDFESVLSQKKNGQAQTASYVQGIVQTVKQAAASPPTINESLELEAGGVGNELQSLHPPFWHFSTRKAIELWPKEVYRTWELFPLCRDLKFGPLSNICGPRMPVLLLKRAFGTDCFEVYYQSVSHQHTQQQQTKPEADEQHEYKQDDRGNLPPLVQAGGTWEGGRKAPLEDQHYVPMQPTARAKRRPTLHNKQQLFRYLERQIEWEQGECLRHHQKQQQQPGKSDKVGCAPTAATTTMITTAQARNGAERPLCTVYMDGVFDLFHVGHLKAIEQCAALGNVVILGVTGDDDATGYKRRPAVPQEERVAMVQGVWCVDRVICPCPLVVTEEFMNHHGIDLVVHGFANDDDAARQATFFEIPQRLGKFRRIGYYQGLSTTQRLKSIRNNEAEKDDGGGGQNQSGSSEEDAMHAPTESTTAPKEERGGQHKTKTTWFGAAIATATNNATTILFDPVSLELRICMEPHLVKARTRRQQALEAIRTATGPTLFDEAYGHYLQSPHAVEQTFTFVVDTPQQQQPLFDIRRAFLEAAGLDANCDLSRLHETKGAKDKALHRLTQQWSSFQQVYDEFVRHVCIPKMAPSQDQADSHSAAAENGDKDVFYYQAFPCVRIIQPDEFSIGPHADVAYGHHPCSVNCYVPLTPIGGASSLFLESRPGSEDWHPIVGDYGMVKSFAGGVCTHWTTDNTTKQTRVSLDFRVIAGPLFQSFACGGSQPGGQLDTFRNQSGYYNRCQQQQDGSWKRDKEFQQQQRPDARNGFPWTVKDWDKFWQKETKQA